MRNNGTKSLSFAITKLTAIIAITMIAIASCGDDSSSHTHEWGAWTQTKAPTETEEGEETRTCTLDTTYKETRSIPKLSIQRNYTITLLGKTVTVTDSRTGANDQTLKQMDIMPKKRAFPDNYMDKLICRDCLSVMREMPDECLDLVVTPPPYNLKNSTSNGMKDGRD
jgi:hypothetical protein